jgi:hypothetical protein
MKKTKKYQPKQPSDRDINVLSTLGISCEAGHRTYPTVESFIAPDWMNTTAAGLASTQNVLTALAGHVDLPKVVVNGEEMDIDTADNLGNPGDPGWVEDSEYLALGPSIRQGKVKSKKWIPDPLRGKRVGARNALCKRWHFRTGLVYDCIAAGLVTNSYDTNSNYGYSRQEKDCPICLGLIDLGSSQYKDLKESCRGRVVVLDDEEEVDDSFYAAADIEDKKPKIEPTNVLSDDVVI